MITQHWIIKQLHPGCENKVSLALSSFIRPSHPLPDSPCLYTTPSGIRTKCSSGIRTPLYLEPWLETDSRTWPSRMITQFQLTINIKTSSSMPIQKVKVLPFIVIIRFMNDSRIRQWERNWTIWAREYLHRKATLLEVEFILHQKSETNYQSLPQMILTNVWSKYRGDHFGVHFWKWWRPNRSALQKCTPI